jgi:hypothetical protein
VEEKLSGIGESLEEFKDLVIKVIVCYKRLEIPAGFAVFL